MSVDPAPPSVRGDAALALLGLTADVDRRVEVSVSDAASRKTGRRILTARTTARMTREELGELVGLELDQVDRLEGGQRGLAPRELPTFAVALGVTIGYLLGSDE